MPEIKVELPEELIEKAEIKGILNQIIIEALERYLDKLKTQTRV